ncbi:MAG: hypothetical protein V4760_18245, partial [Bdellovibrionota bacterium]
MKFNRMTSVATVLVIASAALFLNSCAMKPESTELRLTLPDWNEMRSADHARRSKVSTLAVTTADLSMVVINVTGDGAPPFFWSWERHGDSTAVPPTTIPITVTAGSNRLI